MPNTEAGRPGRSPLQSGFAYVWILLGVALLGLGMALAAEGEAVATQRVKEQELLSIGRQFRAALRSYTETRGVPEMGQYPKTLEDLLQDPRSGVTRRHLRKIFVDPMTGVAQWGLVRAGDRIVGVHSLSTASPLTQQRIESDGFLLEPRGQYRDWVFSYP